MTVSNIDSDTSDVKVLEKVSQLLNGGISAVREELDEHLDSINQNTNEIQSQEDNLLEMSGRVDRLEEKMTDIQLMLRQLLNKSAVSVELNDTEQKAFLVLYTHEHDLTTHQISEKTGLAVDEASNVLTAISDKGIPVEKVQRRDCIVYNLDEGFRRLQAKEQMIKIKPDIIRQFQNKLLARFFEAEDSI